MTQNLIKESNQLITNILKRAFKTIGIFLSAIFLLASCSSDDEPLGKFDETTGEFVVAMQEKVPESQFMQKVVGHGWYEAELHELMASFVA